jgi:hypothetical protein
MGQHHLTNQNAYTIKLIAKSLPAMKYDTQRKLPSIQWKRNLFNFFATLKLTAWICKKIYLRFYADQYDVNHERRLRRAYKRAGIVGVSHKLRMLGVSREVISDYLNDFELTGGDLQEARKIEKLWGKKIVI